MVSRWMQPKNRRKPDRDTMKKSRKKQNFQKQKILDVKNLIKLSRIIYKLLRVPHLRDLARTIFLTHLKKLLMVSNAPDTLWLRFNDFHDKFSDFFGFVSVFNCFVLETQRELDKKLGHYEYLLLVKRSFLGSLVS